MSVALSGDRIQSEQRTLIMSTPRPCGYVSEQDQGDQGLWSEIARLSPTPVEDDHFGSLCIDHWYDEIMVGSADAEPG